MIHRYGDCAGTSAIFQIAMHFGRNRWENSVFTLASPGLMEKNGAAARIVPAVAAGNRARQPGLLLDNGVQPHLYCTGFVVIDAIHIVQ